MAPMGALVPGSGGPGAWQPAHGGRPDGWTAGQGARWAMRNPATAAELDWSYEARFGITRSQLALDFLAERVPRTASVLEVGCSRGVQLDVLAALGWRRLAGVDLSWAALLAARHPVALADGLALPFRDCAFDMVFTSGTLMHIGPALRARFAAEVVRVARRWVWGFELYADVDSPVRWSFGDLLPEAWAAREPSSFISQPVDLRAWRHFGRLGNGMEHCMYLLERRPAG